MGKVYTGDLLFCPRGDSAQNWQQENPVLRLREWGVVLDSDPDSGEWLKIGDGVTAWNDLPFKRGPKGQKGDGFEYEDFTPEQLDKLRGEPGKDAETDLHYTPESDNAQSGKAVAEALENVEIKGLKDITEHSVLTSDGKGGVMANTGLKAYRRHISEEDSGVPGGIYTGPCYVENAAGEIIAIIPMLPVHAQPLVIDGLYGGLTLTSWGELLIGTYADSDKLIKLISGISFNGQASTGVPTPETDDAIAPKGYVDGLLGDVNTILAALVTVE